MFVPQPHFLLYSEVAREAASSRWRFTLTSADGSAKIEAADEEPNTQGERLELLAFVRALEALDQPSRVTLVTNGNYVNRGLQFGIDEWRADGWRWERFGEMVPVKDVDLWQRVDRAMRFHRIDWGTPAEDERLANKPKRPSLMPNSLAAVPYVFGLVTARRRKRRPLGQLFRRKRFKAILRRWWQETNEAIHVRVSQLGTSLLPKPWWQ